MLEIVLFWYASNLMDYCFELLKINILPLCLYLYNNFGNQNFNDSSIQNSIINSHNEKQL